MEPLALPPARTLLCLGAHADDIEIGCGGTLLTWLAARAGLTVHWVVFSGAGTPREAEAQASARRFLTGAGRSDVTVHRFRDGFFPYDAALKDAFEALKAQVRPDLVFTHARDDRHQDHRAVSDLTWNTFRSHTILEYEVPKYDGDLGSPNAFVALAPETLRAKIAHLLEAFPSQRGKPWFTEETFRALPRLRGVECGAASGVAEAFSARKLLLTP